MTVVLLCPANFCIFSRDGVKPHVVQDGLHLLTLGYACLGLQSAGITGMSHGTQPLLYFYVFHTAGREIPLKKDRSGQVIPVFKILHWLQSPYNGS